jgi:hypothetical protein
MIIVIYDVGPSFKYLLFYKNVEVHAPAIYTDEYCKILLKQVGKFKINDITHDHGENKRCKATEYAKIQIYFYLFHLKKKAARYGV